MRGRIYKPRGPMPPWLEPLVDGFLRSLTRRGRRPNTGRAYMYELRDFGEWLNLAGVQSLPELTYSHIEEWQDDVQARKATRTQMVAATAVKELLKWCAKQELAMSNPMLYLRVESPRVPQLTPRPIPLRDLQAIQEALKEPDWRDVLKLRTRALWWLLYSSGSRVGAVLSLNRDGIHDGAALVIQKGGGRHTLLFSELAERAVRDYLSVRSDDNIAMFIGFPTKDRRPGERMTPTSVDCAWNRLARELGISHFSSHSIRHTTATTMLRQRVDSLVIAKHLGHRGLATIQGYAEVALEARREAMQLMQAAS